MWYVFWLIGVEAHLPKSRVTWPTFFAPLPSTIACIVSRAFLRWNSPALSRKRVLTIVSVSENSALPTDGERGTFFFVSTSLFRRFHITLSSTGFVSARVIQWIVISYVKTCYLVFKRWKNFDIYYIDLHKNATDWIIKFVKY